MIVYGIKNCDTVKKALTWLKENNKAFDFHDYKKEGISEAKLKEWCKQVGWEVLLNKRGTTWKQLSDEAKEAVTGEAKSILLMKEKTSIIKRPLIEKDGKVLVVGFDEKAYGEKI